MPPPFPSRGALALLSLLALTGATGCPRREAFGIGAMGMLGPGVINDPKNRSLRFDLLKFGLDQFCREMTQRGAPLKLRDSDPVLGRFFATGCQSELIDDPSRQSFVIRYEGRGYAWTNVTGRMGFTSAGVIEYAPDFRLHEGWMYLYFRPRNVAAASFQTAVVESQLLRTSAAVTGVDPDRIGRDIVDGQLRRGFTVIRYGATGETEFSMGTIPPGKRPFRPFYVESEERVTLDDDRVEVHASQQDFVGGLIVTGEDQALTLTAKLDGAPAVDLVLLPKAAGDPMIDALVRAPGPAALSSPPLLLETLPAGQLFRRSVPVPPGAYYLLVDHSAAIGNAAPPGMPGDDRAAKVDYVIQVGERE